MKKNKKRVILVAVLILLVALGVAAYVLLGPMLGMTPAETGAIGDTGITAVRNARNAVYFIDAGDGYILVDAGSGAEGVQEGMAEMEIAAGDVKWVLLTHSDYDHVAALTLFPDAEIYMSAEELPLLDGRVKRNAGGGNRLPEGVDLTSLTLLPDGEELALGDKTIRCAAMPGHTTGSMGYLVDGGYFFTGDAFLVADGKLGVHPFTMDEAAAKSAIEANTETVNAAALVLTGHYGYYEGSAFSR